jgi:hypothetical protein
MIQFENYDLEILWLKRRIFFIEKLNKLYTDDADAAEMAELGKEFSKVEKPSDLVARLKEIYGEDLP